MIKHVVAVPLDYFTEGSFPGSFSVPMPAEARILDVRLQDRARERGFEPFPFVRYELDGEPAEAQEGGDPEFRVLHIVLDGEPADVPKGTSYLGTVTWPGVERGASLYGVR